MSDIFLRVAFGYLLLVGAVVVTGIVSGMVAAFTGRQSAAWHVLRLSMYGLDILLPVITAVAVGAMLFITTYEIFK